jgi:hypothetical protein
MSARRSSFGEWSRAAAPDEILAANGDARLRELGGVPISTRRKPLGQPRLRKLAIVESTAATSTPQVSIFVGASHGARNPIRSGVRPCSRCDSCMLRLPGTP